MPRYAQAGPMLEGSNSANPMLGQRGTVQSTRAGRWLPKQALIGHEICTYPSIGNLRVTANWWRAAAASEKGAGVDLVIFRLLFNYRVSCMPDSCHLRRPPAPLTGIFLKRELSRSWLTAYY